MFEKSSVDLNSAFYPWIPCILISVCSLHFTPGLQSAVRSLRFTLTVKVIDLVQPRSCLGSYNNL